MAVRLTLTGRVGKVPQLSAAADRVVNGASASHAQTASITRIEETASSVTLSGSWHRSGISANRGGTSVEQRDTMPAPLKLIVTLESA